MRGVASAVPGLVRPSNEQLWATSASCITPDLFGCYCYLLSTITVLRSQRIKKYGTLAADFFYGGVNKITMHFHLSRKLKIMVVHCFHKNLAVTIGFYFYRGTAAVTSTPTAVQISINYSVIDQHQDNIVRFHRGYWIPCFEHLLLENVGIISYWLGT